MSLTAPPRSPFDEVPCAPSLRAHVVTPGLHPRLHGYDVQGDLAVRYGLGEVLLTTLLGRVPDDREAIAFEVALVFAGPVCIADAPAHAACLARLCDARPSGIIGTAAVALAAQARWILQEQRATWAWLAAPLGDPPAAARPASDAERDAVVRLRAALDARRASVSVLEADLGLWPAILAVLLGCGLRHEWQVETALCAARLPSALAEAMCWGPGDLAGYPVNLPRFEYTP